MAHYNQTFLVFKTETMSMESFNISNKPIEQTGITDIQLRRKSSSFNQTPVVATNLPTITFTFGKKSRHKAAEGEELVQ